MVHNTLALWWQLLHSQAPLTFHKNVLSNFSVAEESGSDEDFMVDDDDDSDYGHSKKKGKKVVPKGGRRVEKKDKKSPKPRLKATGNPCRSWFEMM